MAKLTNEQLFEYAEKQLSKLDDEQKDRVRRYLNYKFKRSELQRINRTPVGGEFRFRDKQRKMTTLLKQRITLAINLMKK